MIFPMMRRPRSIVVPMVLLVVGAALIATAVQFAITFTGPPPFAPAVPVEEIVRGFRDGQVDGRFASRLEISDRLAEIPVNGAPHPERDASIARALGVPAGEIHGVYQLVPRQGRGFREERGPRPDPNFIPPFVRGDFEIEWRSAKGVKVVRSRPGPWFTAWHRVTLLSVLGVLIVLTLLAWWISRSIARPIRNLAAAANAARLGTRTPIPQDGPREVRELAQALEAMQGRILEAAEGRTAMLAAIVHDLGTPLSRIAFRIEQLPDAERDRAAADVGEMREMLAEVLRFVRDSRSGAANERIDLDSLLESLADDMREGGMDVVVNPGATAVIAGESQALRRMFVNLIENAVRYGQKAVVGWKLAPGIAEITIDDSGPGFGPDREALFAPFVRGETSRNRATGGTGLGLAIVRRIAEAHGGEVTLEDREGSGGRVRVRLPIERRASPTIATT